MNYWLLSLIVWKINKNVVFFSLEVRLLGNMPNVERDAADFLFRMFVFVCVCVCVCVRERGRERERERERVCVCVYVLMCMYMSALGVWLTAL